MSHELVVRGGHVIDGTGRPARRCDVGVDGGRVTALGEGLAGRDVIDADGCVVTPGFLDLHTHYDPQVLWDPWLSPSSQLGVTSVVAGNCGYSIAPCPPELRGSMLRTLVNVEDMSAATLEAGVDWSFETYPEYLAAVGRRGTAINFGGYVGHTAVRLWVMGEDAYERAATPAEVEAMAAVVREAVAGGAVGFSSDRSPFHRGDGGRPVPSAVATLGEVEALWRAVAATGRGLIHVAPGEDFEWVYDLQPAVGRPVTWSAILAYPEGATSKAAWPDKLAVHRRGRERGAQVHPQVTCRPITFQVSMADPSTFYMVPAFGAVAAADHDGRAALYRDPAWRDRARAELDAGQHVDVRWDRFTVAETTDATVAGASLADLAARQERHPFDVALDIVLADRLQTRFTVVFANDDPAAVGELLRAPGCVLGLSDAGAHVGQMCDAVMPVDFLAAWVRDRGVATPEAGVRRLTGELADLLGLSGRGYLTEGSAADIAVLDWDRLGPGPVRRVADFPAGGDRLVADAPTGIRHVLVNGVPIRRDDAPVAPGPVPGHLLADPPASSPARSKEHSTT